MWFAFSLHDMEACTIAVCQQQGRDRGCISVRRGPIVYVIAEWKYIIWASTSLGSILETADLSGST